MHIFHAALLSTCFHVASPPLGMMVRISARSTIYSFFARGTWFTGIADHSFCVFSAGLRVLVFLDFAYWLNLKLVCAPDPSGGRGEMAMARASSLASLWPGCTLCSCCRVHRCRSSEHSCQGPGVCRDVQANLVQPWLSSGSLRLCTPKCTGPGCMWVNQLHDQRFVFKPGPAGSTWANGHRPKYRWAPTQGTVLDRYTVMF